jgi:nucleotide-binding universal stress UspA family protein
VLLAVHGHEPPGWGAEACRVVSGWGSLTVRVLAVLDIPCPPFTSLTSFARDAYRGARTAWQAHEQRRIQAVLDGLAGVLPPGAEMVRAPSMRGDLARTIAEHARRWAADVVVIGAPRPGLRAWLWPGPVHERLLHRIGCAVMITPSPAAVPRRRVRRLTAPWAIFSWRRSAPADRGA